MKRKPHSHKRDVVDRQIVIERNGMRDSDEYTHSHRHVTHRYKHTNRVSKLSDI